MAPLNSATHLPSAMRKRRNITPALERAGWDSATRIREEFPLTKGRIIVRGKLHPRAQHKRVDYVLSLYRADVV